MTKSTTRMSVLLAGLGLACKPAQAPQEQVLTVFAAASLRAPFAAIEAAFERDHAGVDVQMAHAGSQELRVQIEEGAPADVFAAADLQHMAALVSAKLVEVPIVFAHNELALITRADLQPPLTDLADLPRVERVVLGGSEVPIGRYAKQMLERAQQQFGGNFLAQIEAHVVSREPNVKQVLARIRLGEADAAIVYRSDVVAEDTAIRVMDLPSTVQIRADYPIAVLTHTKQSALARAFVAAVQAPAGQQALSAAGFSAPP